MKNYLIISAFFLIFCCSVSELNAQVIQSNFTKTDSIGYLKVSGSIEVNKKPLQYSVIIVYENKKKINQISSDADGKFTIKLEFEKHYEIDITKQGYVLKKYEFDTHLPESAEKHAIYRFSSFKIVLFPKYKDIYLSILDKPLALIKYDKKNKDFYWDYNYAKSVNEKETELQKKIEELTDEYAKCIEVGNKQFDTKQYREALKNFKRANEIFPDESEPKDKINAINKNLKK